MEIELCGYKVLIDDEDYEIIKKYKWKYKNRSDCLIYFYDTIYDPIKYINTKNGSIEITLHREILGCKYNDGKIVDHISGNTLDNRKCNLRRATNKQNSRNRKNVNPTGFKGVIYRTNCKKWQARIWTDIKRVSLGYYNTPQEAHTAYCEASKKYHGEFGRTE
jgi:hypothetical protein